MSTPNAQGRRLDPGLKRNLLIIIGAVAVAAMLVVFTVFLRTGGSKGASSGTVDVRALSADGKGKPGDVVLTEAQIKKLQEVQRREAEQARKNNDLYIPPDGLGRAVEIPKEPAPGPGVSTANQYRQVGSQVVSHELSREEQDAYARRTAGLAVQLSRYMDGQPKPSAPVRIEFDVKQSAGATSDSAGAQPRPQAAPDSTGAILVDSLEIFAGETASPVDTYKTTYASARILSGVLAGAFLVGQTELQNEGLLTRYTSMRWNGRTFAIDAIALDEKTATDAQDASLDRRYLQRYVMPVLMAGVGGYAQARAQTATMTVSSDGTVVEANGPATKTQAENAAIAAATQIAGRAIDRDAALPIRATLPARTAVGVMFRAPVRESDANPAAPTRQRQQQAAPAPNATAPALVGSLSTPGFAPPARVNGFEAR